MNASIVWSFKSRIWKSSSNNFNWVVIFPVEFKGGYKSKNEDEINNSGFVLTTLEAALWCFYHTDNFEDALIKAVNLCGDADTIGAVCGQIAGAYYGYDAIPERWLESILKRDLIEEKAMQMYNKS